MDEYERELIRRAAQTWHTAKGALEAERLARLRAMTDDDTRLAIVDLLSLPYPDLPERGSGLVEQQRAFRRVR